MGAFIELSASGSPMRCYVAEPAGSGAAPGLVLNHHQDGVDHFTQVWADRLARDGFVVIAPDNYHHSPADADRDAKKAILRDSRIVADVTAAAEFLRAHARSKGQKLGLLGHCMGGRTTWLGGVATNYFSAGAAWYYGGCFVSRGNEGPSPYERLASLSCPILAFSGMLDKSPSPEEVDKMEAEARRLGKSAEFVRYEDVGHAFCSFESPKRYSEMRTEESYVKALAFLRGQLAK